MSNYRRIKPCIVAVNWRERHKVLQIAPAADMASKAQDAES
jgi:hypothetical protein